MERKKFFQFWPNVRRLAVSIFIFIVIIEVTINLTYRSALESAQLGRYAESQLGDIFSRLHYIVAFEGIIFLVLAWFIGFWLLNRIRNSFMPLGRIIDELTQKFGAKDRKTLQHIGENTQHTGEFLRKLKLLQDFSEEEYSIFEGFLKKEEYTPGQMVFKESDPGDKFYIIKMGSVEVRKKVDIGSGRGMEEITLATLDKGGIFGELSFFDNKPRSAGVKAISDVSVLVLDSESIEKLNKDNKTIVIKILRGLIKHIGEKLRKTDESVKDFSRVIFFS